MARYGSLVKKRWVRVVCSVLAVLLLCVLVSWLVQPHTTPGHTFWQVRSRGGECRIWDAGAEPSLAEYLSREELESPAPQCTKWEMRAAYLWQHGPALTVSDLHALWLEPERLRLYNISRPEQLVCCLQEFSRSTQDSEFYNEVADEVFQDRTPCLEMNGTFHVTADEREFVRVVCHVRLPALNVSTSTLPPSDTPPWHLRGGESRRKGGRRRSGRVIYRNLHAFVPRKPAVEERCNQHPMEHDDVSVLILGVDSVSRLEMLRALPLLHDTLLSLEAVPLLGYNKVGDNTFPNVMALLTGLAEHELARSCPWPSPRAKLDPCPFLWSEFARRGYRTAYGEDAMGMAAFNTHKTGFVEQPTDYYLRPYIMAVEQELGHAESMGAYLCYGPDVAISRVLEYVEMFATRFSGEKSFGFFWSTSLTHEGGGLARHADPLYSGLVRRLERSGALNRTVLLVVSDHGVRYGPFRETPQGGLEERLPLAYLAFPEWFRRRFPAAVRHVRQNARRLTSPLDLHATLRDLLHPGDLLQERRLEERARCMHHPQPANCTTESRGLSLFLPIPAERSCADAGVPEHYCTCQESSALSPDSALARQAAVFVVAELNALLLPAKEDCAALRLLDVMSARLIGAEGSHVRVTLRTEPGRALFEATVRTRDGWRLAGPVSRLNTINSQSMCLSEYSLELYCFCLVYLEEEGYTLDSTTPLEEEGFTLHPTRTQSAETTTEHAS